MQRLSLRRRWLILTAFGLCILTGPARAEPDPALQAALQDPNLLPPDDEASPADLDSFYSQRGFQPVWNFTAADADRKIDAFLNSVRALVAYHGLVESRYHLDEIAQLAHADEAANSADPEAADPRGAAHDEKLELLITASLLRLAHDLHGDDLDLGKFYPGWDFTRASADIPTQLQQAIAAGRMEAWFETLAPQTQAYRDLARALAQFRTIAAGAGFPAIAAGPSLKPGMTDPRVAALRARLAAEGYGTQAAADPNLFDPALSQALALYQSRNGLDPDGHAGAATVAALNVPLNARIDQIRANMERWRHMPDAYPPARNVTVNIPDYTVQVTEGGRPIYRGIVIDGKPDRQTPFIDSAITTMVVNPAWHVPVSIARKDILPKLRKNPHYLEKMHIAIDGRDSDPHGVGVNWNQVSDKGFNYRLRQEPGDMNSLGRVKFNFDNPFAVYMHGTPHQQLFSQATRDLSSGCVRLEDPTRFAGLMMADNRDGDQAAGGQWTEDYITSQINTDKTRFVKLANPIPVFFLYWSVFTADDGHVNFRDDIYGYDALLIQKMNAGSTDNR